MKEYKCKCCGKTKECHSTPYLWASIHEEAAGVHDSACVTWKDDYFLCDDCRWQAMKSLLKELAQDACEKCEERDCADCWAMDYQK